MGDNNKKSIDISRTGRGFILDEEKGKPAVIFLSIALAFFLAFVGFFVWHTVRMRSYELDYIKTYGTAVDYVKHHSSSSRGGSRTYYYLVFEYEYEGETYRFIDRQGYHTWTDKMGKTAQIYVDPQHPQSAEVVSSAAFVSIICACFFAFFCVTYAAGMNLLLSIFGSSFKKRMLFSWGADVLFGVITLMLFWLGLPNSGFGEVFTRINGAIGVIVVCGIILLIALADGILTYKLRNYNKYRR